MSSAAGNRVEVARVIFSAQGGRHWTQRTWRATVDGDIGLRLDYAGHGMAPYNSPDDPHETGWYLEIDWPANGPASGIFLAKNLATAREIAARHWLDLLYAEVAEHTAEPDFEARWGGHWGSPGFPFGGIPAADDLSYPDA